MCDGELGVTSTGLSGLSARIFRTLRHGGVARNDWADRVGISRGDASLCANHSLMNSRQLMDGVSIRDGPRLRDRMVWGLGTVLGLGMILGWGTMGLGMVLALPG